MRMIMMKVVMMLIMIMMVVTGKIVMIILKAVDFKPAALVFGGSRK